MKFQATVELHGKTATGVEVPEQVVEALGGGKKPKVLVTVNGFTWRSSVAVMGGRYLTGISAENRKAAGVAAGDAVEVALELDQEVREIVVPADLAAALAAAPNAQSSFAGLSYSRKRGIVEPIEQAKTAETRQRRIAKAVTLLDEGRA